MKKKIKDLLKTETRKKLISNFSALLILKLSNTLLPLITFPYLVRVIGVENFGLLGFVTATVGYFNVLLDYGFQLSATRQISIVKESKEKVVSIYNAVISLKIIFFLFSLILLTIIVFSFNKFEEYWFLYYFAFFGLLGNILFPLWLFQGLEKMKFITYINLFSKTLFSISIFIFVQEKTDYFMIPLLNSFFLIFAGIIAIYTIRKEFGITFNSSNATDMKFQLQESWHIFTGHLAVSLYTVSTTFILGILTNNTITGYYVAAEKLIIAIRGLLTPFLDASYPHIANQIHSSKTIGFKQAEKMLLILFLVTLPMSFFLFFFAEPIVLLVLGEQYHSSIVVFKILSFLPLIIGLSNVMGVLTMLNFGLKKEFSQILMLGSISNLLIAFTLVPIYQHIGSAISVIITETIVLIGFFYHWIQIKKNLSGLENEKI